MWPTGSLARFILHGIDSLVCNLQMRELSVISLGIPTTYLKLSNIWKMLLNEENCCYFNLVTLLFF